MLGTGLVHTAARSLQKRRSEQQETRGQSEPWQGRGNDTLELARRPPASVQTESFTEKVALVQTLEGGVMTS